MNQNPEIEPNSLSQSDEPVSPSDEKKATPATTQATQTLQPALNTPNQTNTTPQPTEAPQIHYIAHKKKWTEYLFEFFMLFLAVFLGFVAENIRENFTERHREREFAESLARDVRIDTANLNQVIEKNLYLKSNYDSLLQLLKVASPANANKLYYYFIPTTYYEPFPSTERTIKQLESAGELRLFRNMDVSDSITAYYDLVHAAEGQQATLLRYFDMYQQQEYQVFSWMQIDTLFFNRDGLLTMDKKMQLKTYDKNTLDILFSKAYTMSILTGIYAQDLRDIYAKAVNTLRFLKREYKLE